MRLGAATEPLDGRTFTVVVDARTDEGAGGSAATLHRVTMSVFPLSFLRFLRCFWWRNRGRSKVGGCLLRSWTRQRRSLPPARAPAARKKAAVGAVLCCAAQEEEENEWSRVFQGCSGLYTAPIQAGWISAVDLEIDGGEEQGSRVG
jgi:hypothetical protein